MNDTNDMVKKDMSKETLKVANPGKLQLTKTVESGKVKQNFTHGRSKSVTVEVRKTRTFAQGAQGNMVEVKAQGGFSTPGGDDDALRHLTPSEREARLKALKTAEEEMKKATENAPSPQENRKSKVEAVAD